MIITEIRNKLTELFQNYASEAPEEIIELPLSGSNRKYFRIVASGRNYIGTFNEDKVENEAFFYLADHFKKFNVPVPEVFIKDKEVGIYIQQDLGSKSLYDYLQEEENSSNEAKLKAYKDVIEQMPLLQIESVKGLDFSKCYPREAFDKQSIMWDLNYFKYCFLKLAYVPFHEQTLEDEFNKFADFLLQAPSDYFLFRDFQSRNIMMYEGKPWFIDFQGGRRGALQYDLASLLYESKASISSEMRKEIIDHYIQVFSRYNFFNADEFKKYFSAFAIVRVLQAFGAYGYRGLFERKAYFVQSIVKGLDNLNEISSDPILKTEFPYLCEIVDKMQKLRHDFHLPQKSKGLTINISSFSYKKGLPEDWSGNGGGFVFDCRSLPNPGRYEKYRLFTGRDQEVIDFMSDKPEVFQFLNNAKSIIAQSVNNYIERGFEHLSVSFGCTGGQHRSVFCAEEIFNYFKMNFDVSLRLFHREQKVEESYVKANVQKKQ